MIELISRYTKRCPIHLSGYVPLFASLIRVAGEEEENVHWKGRLSAHAEGGMKGWEGVVVYIYICARGA